MADHREHGDEQGGDDLLAAERLEFGEHAALVGIVAGIGGQPEADDHGGEQADHANRPEGGAPAEPRADGGAQRHAQDVGDGEAGQDQRDGKAPALGRHEANGDDGGDAEIGAVDDRHHQPRQHKQLEGRGDGAQRMAEDEHAAQQQDQRLARHLLGQQRQDRPAHRNAQRVTRDQIARDRHGDAQPIGDFGQDTGDDELGGAKGEGGQEQGEQRQGHGLPSARGGSG